MQKVLHPKDDVDRLYVSRKEGGRGFARIEDNFDASIQRLEDYIEKHEWILLYSHKDLINNSNANTYTNTGGLCRFGYERIY